MAAADGMAGFEFLDSSKEEPLAPLAPQDGHEAPDAKASPADV